ncbi:hypothetical protein VTL71DRAFT_5148 [Oculimacula yallundae]|uniref:Zn(2)-C6 fungal-type domain-containing protein n=1 Tax=Oculimacula yallundae TaxID=86028 RepID=A0ABR4C0B1_9HELO
MHRNRQPKKRLNNGTAAAEKRPVSCLFCRSRKLRCTRDFPCSNCVERSIPCQLRVAPSATVLVPPSPNTSGISQTEILQRLERLEEIIRYQNLDSYQGSSRQKLLTPSSNHVIQCASNPVKLQPLAADIAGLEKVYIEGSFTKNSLAPDSIIFMVCTIRQVPNMPRYFQATVGQGASNDPTRCVWIPPYNEAKLAIENYINSLTYLHHVIHIPSLWVMLDELYSDLNQHVQSRTGHVALLLSILASTTYSWTAIDCNTSLFPTATEATRQTPLWIKATEDVLDHIHRTTHPSLESAQSAIITLFLVCNLEDLAQRFRSLLSSAIMMARELNLHRTDDPNLLVLEDTTEIETDAVKTEVGRRVWWYLVATDWMLSRYPGPMRGVYLCNPSHMAVQKPRNSHDEDLLTSLQGPERSLSEPTVMSYFLQRIRLAELCRNFTDKTSFLRPDDEASNYNNALSSDAELQALINDFPTFFRLDRVGRQDFADPNTSGTPSIVIQRYMLNALVQIQRCKLHLPWLMRGFAEASYAISHSACLEAARLIMQNELQLEQTGLPFISIRLRFSPMLYGVTMAGLVLSVESALTTGTIPAGHLPIEPAGVSDAFRILREAKQESEIAAKLLESMEKVFRKHKMPTPETPSPDCRAEVRRAEPNTPQSTGSILPNENDIQSTVPSSGSEPSWEVFDPNLDFGALDWNSILSGLNSSFT